MNCALNSQHYLIDVERRIKENQKQIEIKQLLIEKENRKTKIYENDINNKNILIIETQQLIDKKQLQLKVIYMIKIKVVNVVKL